MPTHDFSTSGYFALTDGRGYRWDVGSDGTIWDGTNDAYDGGFVLSGYTPDSQIATIEDGGREIALAADVQGSLSVSRKIYIDPTYGFARFLDSVTNNGASAVTYTFTYATNLGSDGAEHIQNSSSGDTAVSISDDWVISEDNNLSDPNLLFVTSGIQGVNPSSQSSAPGNFYYSYSVAVNPGETKSIMHFASQDYDTNQLATNASFLEALDYSALSGMTSAEKTSVVNFNTSSLFSNSSETVDFNTLVPGSYSAATQYNALDGNDVVYLPEYFEIASSLHYSPTQTFFAGAGNDAVYGGAMYDRIDGGSGNDTLNGGIYDDTLSGGDGDDYFILDVKYGGSDDIDGGTGSDIYEVNWDVGAGFDITENFSAVHTSEGMTTSSGNVIRNIERIVYRAEDGADYITGAIGNDTLLGNAGNDTLDGATGDDRLEGQLGNDLLIGGDGNDFLTGLEGQDTMQGGAGNDQLYSFVGQGLDVLDGGVGTDYAMISRTNLTTNLTLDLSLTGTQALGDGSLVTSIEQLTYRGSLGVDRISGGALADDISGNAGNDSLSGQGGNDSTLR